MFQNNTKELQNKSKNADNALYIKLPLSHMSHKRITRNIGLPLDYIQNQYSKDIHSLVQNTEYRKQ